MWRRFNWKSRKRKPGNPFIQTEETGADSLILFHPQKSGHTTSVIYRRVLPRHNLRLLQGIWRGFEELGESIFVDGFLIRLFGRDPFLREQILDGVIKVCMPTFFPACMSEAI